MVKKAAIIPVMALLFVMLASCDLSPDLNEDLLPDLEEGFFYAQNITDGKFYVLEAEILYEGEKCVIWAEIGSGVTEEQAKNIAREYDTKIRQKIVDTFGKKDFDVEYRNEIYHFSDILDYANWLVGGDEDDRKLTILLLDIKDGFKDPEEDSYVAGYFYSVDFLRKGRNRINNRNYYSNGRDMMYVDTDPGLKEDTIQAYATFAHELQHLVNYVTTVLIGRDKAMDIWINEGLSAYAEYLYLEKNPEEKCLWMNDSRNTVKTGNNFFVWGNHGNEPLAIMDDYATVYLFFRWLYLQADAGLQSRIFHDIITSSHYDYRAVTSAAGKDWENLLRTWFAANYDPKNAVYGYKNDLYLQEGRGSNYPMYKGIRVTPIGDRSISLYPGEGVYSIINNDFTPAVSGTHIRYAGLSNNTNVINTSSPYSGNVLLTFNANTNNGAGRENGYLTGVSPSITTSPTASRTAADNARSAGAGQTRPFVIDAWDMLGRNQDVPIRVWR